MSSKPHNPFKNRDPEHRVLEEVHGFDRRIDWSATDSRDVLPTKGTAPESIMAWKIPTGRREPHPLPLATIGIDIATPSHFDDLNEDTQIARDAMQSDAYRVDLVFHLAEGGWKGAREDAHERTHVGVDWNRLDRSTMQPNIRLLPDLQGIWGEEGWKERAVAARAGGYHMFYTLAKGGPLAPNSCTGWKVPQVHGDIFLLKVSQDVDEQGYRFYENASPSLEDLKTYLWRGASRGK